MSKYRDGESSCYDVKIGNTIKSRSVYNILKNDNLKFQMGFVLYDNNRIPVWRPYLPVPNGHSSIGLLWRDGKWENIYTIQMHQKKGTQYIEYEVSDLDFEGKQVQIPRVSFELTYSFKTYLQKLIVIKPCDSVYFAYGSNMSIKRLHERISSAVIIGFAVLGRHQLKFHKPSKDGSGKCDALHTGDTNDKVFGVLYSVQTSQLPELDKCEGCGYGYERVSVEVHSESNEPIYAETYIATQFDSILRPYDWYKEHVLRGAKDAGLPRSYIDQLQAVDSVVDEDKGRRTKELSIYD